MTAYYNEFDEKAAAWLRELIARGLIAPGDVDTRSIEDVAPADLVGYSQCHFFAGIGVWSYALRRSGWPDDRPVWTGSCPCQPFSAAGKGAGFADERHLWPAWFWLIEQCRPGVLLGEQVASKDAEPWLDLVQADLEALGYAFGACAFPSAGIGAPHIRDRTYWLADDDDEGLEGRRQPGRERTAERLAGASGVAGGLGHSERLGAGRNARAGGGAESRDRSGLVGDDDRSPGATRGMADCASYGRREECSNDRGLVVGDRAKRLAAGLGTGGGDSRPGPTNGLWRAADWLLCRDGKWRPVEPGTFPLAHGAPARVGRLRGYGNAINAEAAVAWIEAYLEGRTIDQQRVRLEDVFA